MNRLTSSVTALLVALTILQAADAPLSDTGLTTRYTQTFGEDADFKGLQPAFKDHGDGTITDLVTGLMWQKADGGEMTHDKARDYALSLQLGGHADWRLPGSMELFSIMNHAMHGPAMDTALFTATAARYWWTDSPRADDLSKIWLVNTGGGIGAHARTETVSAGGDRPVHVRCVRGIATFGPGPILADNGNGMLTDSRTGLIWQKIGPTERMGWEEALKYCDSLWLSGQNGWRLPNIKELRSLSDDCLAQPSLDRKFFPHAESAPYWSSTTQSNRPERAWFVDFTSGLVTYSDKTDRHLVLAVRGGTAESASREKPVPAPKTLAGSGKGDAKGKGGRKGGGPKKSE